jgi:hypothetical protein
VPQRNFGSARIRRARCRRVVNAKKASAVSMIASVIADWAAKSMPIQLLQDLSIPEGRKVLEDLWPDMVNAFFKAHSTLSPAVRVYKLW